MGMEMDGDRDGDRAGDGGGTWMGMGTGTFWLQGHISCWPCVLPLDVRAASQDAAAAWCPHRDPSVPSSVPSPVPFRCPVPRGALQGWGDRGCWCLMGMQHCGGEPWPCEGVRVLVGVHVSVCMWGGCVHMCACTSAGVHACVCTYVCTRQQAVYRCVHM